MNIQDRGGKNERNKNKAIGNEVFNHCFLRGMTGLNE